jgi:hypothetical protein
VAWAARRPAAWLSSPATQELQITIAISKFGDI